MFKIRGKVGGDFCKNGVGKVRGVGGEIWLWIKGLLKAFYIGKGECVS